MRKLAVMVAVSMVISLAGCGSSGSDGEKEAVLPVLPRQKRK